MGVIHLRRRGLILPAEAPDEGDPEAPTAKPTPSTTVNTNQQFTVWFDNSHRAGFEPADPGAQTGLVAYMTQTAGPSVTVTDQTSAFEDSKKLFTPTQAGTAYTFDCHVEDTNYDPPVASPVVERTYTTQTDPPPSPFEPLGDGDLAAFESRLKNENVLWGWVMDRGGDPYAAIGGTGFDENAGLSGSSVPTRSIVDAPANNVVNTGKVMRLRFPVSEAGVQHNQFTGYGQYCRRRFHLMNPALAPRRSAFLRYHLYLPANFHPYNGGKIPSFFGHPTNQPLAGADGKSSGDVYNDYSWWAGIMWNGPSSMTGTYPNKTYTGDSNLDHIRVQCYVYAKQINGVTFTQAAVDAGLRGYAVKMRNGLNQDPTATPTGSGTGSGSNIYLNRGAWNTIEQEVVINTSGQANGHLRIWVNGVLGLNFKNVKWAADAYNTTAEINGLEMSTFFGGPSSNATDQSMFFDDFTISGAYIGPRSGA